jgi:pyrroline-5-carboxylate reductase
MNGPLLLVGCGKMGGALLRGWRAKGLAPDQILVIEPNPTSGAAAQDAGVKIVADASQIPASFIPRAVILAVKPQVVAAVAAPFARFAGQAGYLSIAAGKTLAGFEALFGAAASIVRAMPNTPAAIGQGITVACANARAGKPFRDLCHDLLGAVGEVAWVDDESLLDAVTAVSGSGPAYVFLLIEAMTEAGVAVGLAPDLALRLARVTVAGSGELARRTGSDPAQLRADVTSPGGTTEAALRVLMVDGGAGGGLKGLMARAIAAATRRSRELAS